MHDILNQVIAIARSMWRYRWLSLLVSWLICLAGWAWVYTLPNQYESKTRVYVDTESALRPLIQGLATETNVMSQVNLMTRALLSRPHLEKVARETDLDLRADTPKAMDRLIDRLRMTIQIERGRTDNFYAIAYRDRDPETAHAVVQTLLSNFVSDTLITKREEEMGAMRFLEEQILAHEERLAEAEQKLADFKKENVGRMPGAMGGYYERLQRAMDEASSLQRRYTLAVRSRDELINQLEGEEPVFGIASPTTPTSTRNPADDARLARMREQLDDLRLNYTDKHPDVVALVERIETLEAQASAVPDEMPTEMAAAPEQINPLDRNPVYQSLRIALSGAEVEVAQLRVKLQQQQATVESLRRAVDTVPEVEAQLKRLNRDYNVTKERYEALIQRREAAKLRDEAVETSDDIQFRVIDPPSVPLEPVGPNRPVFLTVTLIGALGAGLAFAFLLSQINPVFSSRQELRKITSLPVLGSVSVIMMPREKLVRRVQTSAFALGLVMLVIVFAGAVVFEEPAVRFAQAVQNGTLS